MILVTVGASLFSFDRLMTAVETLSVEEPLVVQHGPAALTRTDARRIPYLPLEELAGLVREARVVITHAGAGSVLLALTNGKRPVVVPRLHAFGETVDDHQLDSARRFAKAGLVTVVEDMANLQSAVSGSAPMSIELSTEEVPLVRELKSYLSEVVGR
jgi:UDP-N-acetylglucosamine transferase subunit ALG13